MAFQIETSAPDRNVVDVAIIGAGLAGTCAAFALSGRGYRVALVDARATYPHEFRAEKFGEAEMAAFGRIGLADIVRAVATPVDEIAVHRFGRLYRTVRRREYGFAYADVVNRLRRALPDGVRFVLGRVESVATSPDRQEILMADGREIKARLLVVATGLGDLVRRKLQVGHVELSPAHSLSFGFDLAAPVASFPFQALVRYGRSTRERMAYLTLFPLGTTMRGNLFVYRMARDDWAKAMRDAPDETLRALFPELRPSCDDFRLRGKVELRQSAVGHVVGHERDGVVLIGDAFCETCPAPGVGIPRVLTDTERLCSVHVPRWLATPGMGVDKIREFYADPLKRRSDGTAIRSSLYARRIAVDPGAIWAARRLRNRIVRGAALMARRLAAG